ncbi:MAG: amidohydrolase family protein [Candidatus Heimdallarchaeaceae archaeon]
MTLIFAPNALVGENLDLDHNLYITISDDGLIREISKTSSLRVKISLPESSLLIPGFINAHVHVGDAFLKDHGYGLTLDEIVGEKGLKHQKLQQSTKQEKIKSIKNSLELSCENGITTLIDFREEGRKGVNLLNQLMNDTLLRVIILGRPSDNNNLDDLFSISDGIGFPDIFSLNNSIVNQVNSQKKANSSFLVSIHLAESEEVVERSLSRFGKSDIQLATELLELDFVVHCNYASVEDLKLLRSLGVNIVCCPYSNAFNSLKFPPLKELFELGFIVGLGTDNVQFSNPDPFSLMSFTLIYGRSLGQIFSPKEILKTLTVNPGLIVKRKIGQIKKGFIADLLAIDLSSSNTVFSRDVYTAITLRAKASDILFHMYKGMIVKWKDQK